jgi:hypothetical protein
MLLTRILPEPVFIERCGHFVVSKAGKIARAVHKTAPEMNSG